VLYLKRVIAIGGDTVEGRDNEIFLHGALSSEKYVEHISSEVLMPFQSSFGPTRVPEGQCFVMGDNRDCSLDSRSPDFGFVDDRSIVGGPLYIVRSKNERSGRNLN
jgi:signal peptidase I